MTRSVVVAGTAAAALACFGCPAESDIQLPAAAVLLLLLFIYV